MQKLSVIGAKCSLFNHGHVILLDAMPSHIDPKDPLGAERKILDAARTSTNLDTITKKNKNTQVVYDEKRDVKLLQYLMKHEHWTPFEQIQFQLHMRLPMFVFGHLIRYRTGSWNVESARYTKYEPEFYIPQKERLCIQNQINKQGSSDAIIDQNGIGLFYHNIELVQNIYDNYEDLVEEHKLSKEIARITNPQNMFISCVLSMNLRNILHLIRQRTHPSAQYETRQYAFAIYNLIEKVAPITVGTFLDSQVFNLNINPDDLEDSVYYCIECDSLKEQVSQINKLKQDFNNLPEIEYA